nr:hypothetical protein [Streptomyces chartreusis]
MISAKLAGSDWAAVQQPPFGLGEDHRLHGVLLVLAGDELVPVFASGGRSSHPELGAVNDPGLPVGAEMVDDFGEGTQPEAGCDGAASFGEQGARFTHRTRDGGTVETEQAGQYIVRGTVAWTGYPPGAAYPGPVFAVEPPRPAHVAAAAVHVVRAVGSHGSPAVAE